MTQPADAITKAIAEDLHQRYVALEQRNVALEQQIVALHKYNEELVAKVRWLEEQFHLARHRQFGASSERTPVEQRSLLFNEAEAEADTAPPPEKEQSEATGKPARRRKARGHREVMLKDLPVETSEEFHTWLERQAACTLPKSVLGQAVQYCLNQWTKLTAFLKDGRLELDNNRSERAIKQLVIGRKNWLFANTPRGARTSAIIYSIVVTAAENGLNPLAYLTDLLARLPNMDVGNPAALDDLLPWSANLPAACRMPATATA